LLQKVISAQSRPELTAALKSLDRVLRHGFYDIPHWYGSVHRVAWRADRFGMPANLPIYYQPEPWATSSWWAKVTSKGP
jgi:microcin C transport system substrate-binding protein